MMMIKLFILFYLLITMAGCCKSCNTVTGPDIEQEQLITETEKMKIHISGNVITYDPHISGKKQGETI